MPAKSPVCPLGARLRRIVILRLIIIAGRFTPASSAQINCETQTQFPTTMSQNRRSRASRFDLFVETLRSIGGENLVAVVSTRDAMLAEENRTHTRDRVAALTGFGRYRDDERCDRHLVEHMGPDEGVDIRMAERPALRYR